MPSIYQLKNAFSDLLRPITRQLAARGVSANQVTLAALWGSLIVAGLLYLGETQWQWPVEIWLAMPVWMLLRMGLNNIDGMLAREHNMATPLGAMLNEMGDVLSDSVLFLAFAAVPGIHIPLLVSLTLLSVISEMAGVVAVQIGAQRRYDGPSGKSDRALLFGVLALVIALGVDAGLWSTIVLALINLLLLLTIVNRLRQALKEVARKN